MRSKRRIFIFSRRARKTSCTASSTVVLPPDTLVARRASTSAGFASATVLTTAFARLTKGSPLATKSVSQLISTSAPHLSSLYAATTPSAATLLAFLAADARPFSLKISIALSMSPSDSTRAFLQSIIPTPVFSRRA